MSKFFQSGFLILLWSLLMVMLLWGNGADLAMFPKKWREQTQAICKNKMVCDRIEFEQWTMKSSRKTGLRATVHGKPQSFEQAKAEILAQVPHELADRIEVTFKQAKSAR